MSEMIEAFRRLGHEVEIYEYNLGQSSQNEPKAGGIKSFLKGAVPEVVWGTLRDYRYLKSHAAHRAAIAKRIRKFQPDIVYERAHYLSSVGVRLAKANNIPHLLEINAPFPEEKRNMEGSSFIDVVPELKNILSMTSRVVCVSTNLKEYFVDYVEADPGKFHIEPNGVNIGSFISRPELTAEIQSKFALRESFVFGFVGSVFPYHGVDILVKSFASVREKYPAVKLLIVGDGMLNESRGLAKSHGVENDVHFTGPVDPKEVASYIQAMDACVMADSNVYGSPVKLFEYGALAKPIIAPNKGPVTEVFEDGVSALITDADKDALTKCMLRLIENKDLCGRIGQGALDVANANDWQVKAERTLSLVEL